MRPTTPLTAAAVLAAAVSAVPLLYLGVTVAGLNAGQVLGTVAEDRTVRLLTTTLLLAGTVTAGSVLLGLGTAYALHAWDFPGRRVFAVLAGLPLAVPSYVAAYTWVSLTPAVAGFAGVALVLTLCCHPYVHLLASAALRGLDPGLAEVARATGRGPVRVFWSVTARQLRPALAAGGLLVATYVLADFGSVSILRVQTLTRAIAVSLENSFGRLVPITLSLLLVAVSALVVAGELRSRGRARYARAGGGARRPSPRVRLRRVPAAVVVTAFTVLAALALGVPAGSLVRWLVAGSSGALDVARLWETTATTSLLAAGGAALTLLLALPIGVVAGRSGGRLARVLEGASWLSHTVPGIVVALSLVYLTLQVAPGAYLTAPVLLVAYAVLFLPLAVGAVRTAVAQSPPVLEEVARSLGRRPGQVLRQVTLPLAAPGVLTGALLVFLSCTKELTATLVLHPTGTETLAMRLWSATTAGQYAAAAPYAALVVLLAAVPAHLVARDPARHAGRDAEPDPDRDDTRDRPAVPA